MSESDAARVNLVAVLQTPASEQLGVNRPTPWASVQDPASPAGIPQLALTELAGWAVHHGIPCAPVVRARIVRTIATAPSALDVAPAT